MPVRIGAQRVYGHPSTKGSAAEHHDLGDTDSSRGNGVRYVAFLSTAKWYRHLLYVNMVSILMNWSWSRCTFMAATHYINKNLSQPCKASRKLSMICEFPVTCTQFLASCRTFTSKQNTSHLTHISSNVTSLSPACTQLLGP